MSSNPEEKYTRSNAWVTGAPTWLKPICDHLRHSLHTYSLWSKLLLLCFTTTCLSVRVSLSVGCHTGRATFHLQCHITVVSPLPGSVPSSTAVHITLRASS